MKIADLGPHEVAVVLGSGLSQIAAHLGDTTAIPYSELEGMPSSAVAGHEGALHDAWVHGHRVLFFAGRVHLYEGHAPDAVCFSVRAAVEAGCSTIILTNAAGGIAGRLEVGEPCLISDHINLTGQNALSGGASFLDLTDLYDPGLRALARSVDERLQEGVYAGVAGPTYETPAEVRMLASLGADLVGMSTVLEAIAARAAGARVLGISIVSNRAAGLTGRPLDHEEVADAGRRTSGRLEKLLEDTIGRL